MQIVHLICVQLQLPPPVLSAQPPAVTGAGTARQPKGRRVLPVVAEFQTILELISPTSLGSEVGSNNEVEDNLGCGKLSFRVVLGCYHSPEEFVCKALQAVHPFDRLDVLPDVLKIRLFQALTKGPITLMTTLSCPLSC